MNELTEIREELFCIHFETKTLAGYINDGKLERWLPDFTEKSTEDSHLKRYLLAQKYVKDKNVLDIACGAGRGTYLLATEGGAKAVLGMDIDRDAIRYASYRNKHENADFQYGDATSFYKEDEFDTIISFETIEHLPEIDSFLLNVNKSLKKNGLFLVSTPISRFKLDNKPTNPFHVREWGVKSFQDEISRYFRISEIYFQMYPYLGLSRLSRVKKGIKRIILNASSNKPFLSTVYSRDEMPEYIRPEMMGKQYKGYQILVCNKK